MRARLSVLKTLALVGLCAAGACRETNEATPEGTGGSMDPGKPRCASDQEITIVAGQGVGDDFMPFEGGDAIVPYFGSQIGMEVEISISLTGFDPSDIDALEVLLNVDGAPIGQDDFPASDVYCDGNESATIETPVLIDVTDHPTVTSVAQLNGRDAEIEVRIEGPDGPLEERVQVVIEL